MKRTGYKKLFIEKVGQVYGLNIESATKQFNRLYRQGLKLYGKDRPFIATRELYYSMLGMGKSQAFKFSDDLQLDTAYKLDKVDKLKSDLSELRDKSKRVGKEIDKLIKDYDEEKISYKEFLEKLEDYKSTAEYKATQKEHRFKSSDYVQPKKRRKNGAVDLPIKVRITRKKNVHKKGK